MENSRENLSIVPWTQNSRRRSRCTYSVLRIQLAEARPSDRSSRHGNKLCFRIALKLLEQRQQCDQKAPSRLRLLSTALETDDRLASPTFTSVLPFPFQRISLTPVMPHTPLLFSSHAFLVTSLESLSTSPALLRASTSLPRHSLFDALFIRYGREGQYPSKAVT